jgi:hypothetical protein
VFCIELEVACKCRCWLDKLESSAHMARLDAAAGYPHLQKQEFMVCYSYNLLQPY